MHCGQDMKTTKVSFSRGLDKEDVHIYNGVLLSHRKDEMLPVVIFYLKNILVGEINQKKSKEPYDFIQMKATNKNS